jgi:cell division protein FtsI/penicillin-binding protein 2
VISSEAARATRAAMVDAVNGDLGRLFAGQADITLHGISNARTAGKTGTAQLGGEGAPHSWFIGFAPGEADAEPAIAIAVLVERGGSGSGRAAPIGGRVMAEWLRLSGGR